MAIAKAYAAEGASLIINARTASNLEKVAEDIRNEFACAVTTLACDLNEVDELAPLLRDVLSNQHVDVLINNAGIHIPSRFLDYQFEDFRSVIETNLYSVFHLCQLVIPTMLDFGAGRVINIAFYCRQNGVRGIRLHITLLSIAVLGLTRCLALEMGPQNVLVNAICPWIVDTDMADDIVEKHAVMGKMSSNDLRQRMNQSVPLGRFIRPEEVASVAVFLGSDEASYINGQSWTVDGGYTMI